MIEQKILLQNIHPFIISLPLEILMTEIICYERNINDERFAGLAENVKTFNRKRLIVYNAILEQVHHVKYEGDGKFSSL